MFEPERSWRDMNRLDNPVLQTWEPTTGTMVGLGGEIGTGF